MRINYLNLGKEGKLAVSNVIINLNYLIVKIGRRRKFDHAVNVKITVQNEVKRRRLTKRTRRHTKIKKCRTHCKQRRKIKIC